MKLEESDLYELANNMHSRANSFGYHEVPEVRAFARFTLQDLAEHHSVPEFRHDTAKMVAYRQRIVALFPCNALINQGKFVL